MILAKTRLSEMREHAISSRTISRRQSAPQRVCDAVTSLTEIEHVVG